MNNEQIYSILGQGLNIANQKGCFNLEESATLANALMQLKQVLNPEQKEVLNLVKEENDTAKAK
jgi:hypothetical protein